MVRFLRLQSAHYVFTSLNVPDVGIDNHAYVFFLGLLMSQFCITGCAGPACWPPAIPNI